MKLSYHIGPVALALGFLGALVHADTVKLKDGTILTGDIRSESATNLTLEVAIAHGTILETKTVARDDVVEIVRLTPEQKADQAMEEAYTHTQRYRLDPENTRPVDAYAPVITSVFRQFLATWPTSPHTNEIAAQIQEWTAERDRVATGKSKVNGVWMATADAQRLTGETRARTFINQGKAFAAQGQNALALDAFSRALTQTKALAGATEARELIAEICRNWGESLQRQRVAQTAVVKQSDERLATARQESGKAQAVLAAATGRRSPTVIGSEAEFLRAQNSAQTAGIELLSAEASARLAHEQLTSLDSQIAEVQAQTTKLAQIPLPVSASAPTTTVTAAAANQAKTIEAIDTTTGSGTTPDVLVQVADIFRRYWVGAVVGIVLVAWVCVRYFAG